MAPVDDYSTEHYQTAQIHALCHACSNVVFDCNTCRFAYQQLPPFRLPFGLLVSFRLAIHTVSDSTDHLGQTVCAHLHLMLPSNCKTWCAAYLAPCCQVKRLVSLHRDHHILVIRYEPLQRIAASRSACPCDTLLQSAAGLRRHGVSVLHTALNCKLEIRVIVVIVILGTVDRQPGIGISRPLL